MKEKEVVECPYCHGDNRGNYTNDIDNDDTKGEFITVCKHCHRQFRVKFTKIIKLESKKLEEEIR
jgi:uncharacterized Zn-finger protein